MQERSSESDFTKIKLSLLKYLWLSVPSFKDKKETIPNFLSHVESLRSFSLLERKILANHLHFRTYNHHERIFKQGDRGLGIYYIFSGRVSIWGQEKDVQAEILHSDSTLGTPSYQEGGGPIVILKQHEQFGEMSLIQENSLRYASALAQGPTELLALFRPDLEDLMANSPVVASKILLGIAQVMAYRIHSLTLEGLEDLSPSIPPRSISEKGKKE